MKRNITRNPLVTLALAEKISALKTAKYLETRAKRGSHAKFERAMSLVAKVEPADYDRLPTKSERGFKQGK